MHRVFTRMLVVSFGLLAVVGLAFFLLSPDVPWQAKVLAPLIVGTVVGFIGHMATLV